jgi:hypothetical protein
LKRILLFALLCITGLAAANPNAPKKLDCPLPRSTMDAEKFKIASSGAMSVVKDTTGRQWNVYIYSVKKRVDKDMIKALISNVKNEQPRMAKEVFGAWMCQYDGDDSAVLFEGSSSYLAH